MHEWEALLDRLDAATEETALIAETIGTIYPHEGRKIQIESIRALISIDASSSELLTTH